MAVEAAIIYFALLHADDEDVGEPKFIGPKMTWQQGNQTLCFALGRVSVDGVNKICSVFWYQGDDGNLIAVERSNWATIGYLHGATSCEAYSDFDSNIKPMRVQHAPMAWHHSNQDGVKCKLWTVPQSEVTVVSMESIRKVAFAMATMSDALAKEAHHEIRMDEFRNQIASVQGQYTIVFTCDGRPPSTVFTEHLPCSFKHVPGPASLAPKASAFHYDAKAFLKKWDQCHITVWGGILGLADASHEHAVSRCIQGPEGKDIGRKCFMIRGCRTRFVEEHHGRRNVLALTLSSKDSSESEHFFAFSSNDAREAFAQFLVSSVE